MSEAILSVIKNLMDGVMNNVLLKHAFIAEEFRRYSIGLKQEKRLPNWEEELA